MTRKKRKMARSRSKTAYTHLRRTPYQALAAVVINTVTFFIITVFTVIFIVTNNMLGFLESRPQVTAFFQDTATNEQVQSLESRLESSGVTQTISYISKEEALEIYQEQNKDNPLLLEMVTADILPASLEASARDVDDLETIASIMSADESVEEVIYQKDIIDSLRLWTRGVRAIGIALSSIFVLTSILTIAIIIGLKTASRKHEINTLSLLGASSWYIKSPFIIEGIFYSTTGSLIGWGITYLIILYLTPNLIAFFQNTPIFPIHWSTMLIVLGVQILLGLFVGTIASLLATRRYGK